MGSIVFAQALQIGLGGDVAEGGPLLRGEDLATSPGLAEMALEMARSWEPRLLLRGVSAPCVRCLVDEREEAAVITELHERIFPGPPGEPIA